MPGPANGDGGSGRRKSFAFFSRPSVFLELEGQWTQSTTKQRPKSLFASPDVSSIVASTTTPRQKVLTRSPVTRPKSVFGSLKSREPPSPAIHSSASSSLDSAPSDTGSAIQDVSAILEHCGELVTSGGLLRKKKEFLVLTNRELLRYKSEQKAIDVFGAAVATKGRPVGHAGGGRAASTASLGELPSENALIAMMSQVVAVYHPGGDRESDCSIQLDYLDGIIGSPSSTVLMASTPAEAQQWVVKLRSVARESRISHPPPDPGESTLDRIAKRVEAERDYSPTDLQTFRVVQRPGKFTHKTSSIEDLQKMYSTICHLAIGMHKIHLIPIKVATGKHTSSLPTFTATSYPILNLTRLYISEFDDSFTLTFRYPGRVPQGINLASVDAATIIQSIRQCLDYLRPMWQIPPFIMDIPEFLKDEPLPATPPTPGDDLGGLDRTLAAYCTAYECDVSNIAYCVYQDVEDAPQFALYPPAHSRRRHYTDLELLAILRALRWNDHICSVSFRRISLDALADVCDNYGTEYEPRCERSGRRINLKISQGQRSLLVHELRGLALYNSKLRRMDFGESIRGCHKARDPRVSISLSEKACAIVEAIMPLCRRGLTNADWFSLSGIDMVESDLDWLVDAAASRLAHFRGFELARCGLTERMLTLFLNALIAHENTLECLDLSGNPGRMHSSELNNAMCYFPFLRKLNVSRLVRVFPNEAALTAETLLRWRLEDLDLSETKLNQESVDAIATYLSSPQSESLRRLNLSQCALTGKEVATLLHGMNPEPYRARFLHLFIGQNPLAEQSFDFIDCIERNVTPSHITMRMTDWPKEDTFRHFIRAVTVCKSLTYLDISKTSLPYEASKQTCMVLGDLFANNDTLREIDVSGELAFLESVRLGSGLVEPLARLAENTTLEVLRIEMQALGTPGANMLASLLSKNTTLRELYCENNDIHLQGFTAMVNAMEENKTLTFLPYMDHDRAEHIRALKEKLFQPVAAVAPATDVKEEKHHVKKPSSFRRGSKSKKVSFSEDEALNLVGVEKNLQLLEQKWESEVTRLRNYLTRNMELRMRNDDENTNRRFGV